MATDSVADVSPSTDFGPPPGIKVARLDSSPQIPISFLNHVRSKHPDGYKLRQEKEAA
jgi:hypothetical protein